MRKSEMKHVCMSKTQLKLMNLMRPEKKEVKERIERRKQKRTKVAESNKLFFKKRKNKRVFCYQQVNFIKKLRKDD